MYLTSEHIVGGKSLNGSTDDLAYIVRFCWETPIHMKEAIKILLSARLDGGDTLRTRFDAENSAVVEEVQLRLASNPLTSEEVLDYLRKIGSNRVCERVALNPRSPEIVLLELSAHADADVRAAIGENPYCPITVLYSLARDEHPDVRFRLAENPNVPDSILEELAQDSNPFVSARASATLRRLSCGEVVEANFRFGNQAQQKNVAT